ncbi:MAG: ABC transporter substrate-binding protein [Bacteroidales bacterium]|nr:ABC transporter substrate-binding protein [Bacteroidales bacterium]
MIRILSIITAVIVVASCNNPTNEKENNIKNGIRIISLAPSITNELESLNMAGNIVGATSYCNISAKNKELIVGTATEVNIEKVLLLNPDIVFASGLTKENTINALKKNGIAVHRVNTMQSFDDICDHFIELGKLVGKADLAQSIVNKSKKRVDSMSNSVPNQLNKLTVFFQIGAKPIYTVIPNTFMNDYITLAKCINIAADLEKGIITRESVLQRNPDIIFIVTMGIVGDNEKNIWESYAELNAAKSKNIFIIDSDIASTPTVLSFTETLEQVINNIHN